MQTVSYILLCLNEIPGSLNVLCLYLCNLVFFDIGMEVFCLPAVCIFLRPLIWRGRGETLLIGQVRLWQVPLRNHKLFPVFATCKLFQINCGVVGLHSFILYVSFLHSVFVRIVQN
jgi:hypothetical protein